MQDSYVCAIHYAFTFDCMYLRKLFIVQNKRYKIQLTNFEISVQMGTNPFKRSFYLGNYRSECSFNLTSFFISLYKNYFANEAFRWQSFYSLLYCDCTNKYTK